MHLLKNIKYFNKREVMVGLVLLSVISALLVGAYTVSARATQLVPIYYFYAAPQSIEYGGATTLYWATGNADYCVFWGSTPDTATQRLVAPTGGYGTTYLTTDAVYYLACVNNGPKNWGVSVTASAWVYVSAPPPPAPVACTSAPNGCGMTSPGMQPYGGSCDAVTPPNSSCPACSSAPNACGQVNTGLLLYGSCTAGGPPGNGSCPPPVINKGSGGFYVQPSTVGAPQTVTLHWSVTHATACSITGDNGFTTSGGASGAADTTISAATNFTLTCINGAGGPSTSTSVKVIFDPHFKEI